jgi:hypothetical protein
MDTVPLFCSGTDPWVRMFLYILLCLFYFAFLKYFLLRRVYNLPFPEYINIRIRWYFLIVVILLFLYPQHIIQFFHDVYDVFQELIYVIYHYISFSFW